MSVPRGRRKAALTLAGLAIVAVALATGLHGAETIAKDCSDCLDFSWMKEGFTFEYAVSDDATTLDTYRRVVTDETSDTITIATVWANETGAKWGSRVTYDKEARQNPNTTDAWTSQWVNATNLNDDGAWIGTQDASEVSDPIYYRFDNSSYEWYYNQDSGYFEKVQTDGLGDLSVGLTDTTTDGNIPDTLHHDVISKVDVLDYTVPVVNQTDPADNEVKPRACDSQVQFLLMPRDECTGPRSNNHTFEADENFTIDKLSIDVWPLFSGRFLIKFYEGYDTSNVYLTIECNVPHTADGPGDIEACTVVEEDWSGAGVDNGPHGYYGVADYDTCLTPRRTEHGPNPGLPGCYYTLRPTLVGNVTERGTGP